MEHLLIVPPAQGSFAPQGALCEHILVPEDALQDDGDLVQAVIDFVNHVQEQAFLVPGEYPEEASWSYCADYYFCQVENGGHGQYAGNSRMMARGLRDCRLGLRAMGALSYLSIFESFLKLMAPGDERAQAIREGGGFGDIDPAIRELDDRFFGLKNMQQLNAAWLRTLPCLRALSRPELEAALAALPQANPKLPARRDAAAAAKKKFESEDPTYSAAHACCAQEGTQFLNLTAGMPIGPNGEAGIEWGAMTSGGFRWLRVIHDSHAELRDEARNLRGIYFYETRSSYPFADVGDGKVRSALLGRKKSSRAAAPLDQLALFYLTPLAEITFRLAPEGTPGVTQLLATAHYCNNSFYMPRQVWSGFARGAEHSTFRLLVSTIFWDLSVNQIRSADPNVLEADNIALTAMAAAGALAAAGAAAVRMLRLDQIAVLSADAPADLKREQMNVLMQLHKVREWWQQGLAQIARTLAAAKPERNLFLRPSAYKAAWTLLSGTGDGGMAATLARRMAFFDREYPPATVGFEKIMRATLAAFAAAPLEINILATTRALEAMDRKPPTITGRGLYRLSVPGQVGVKSRDPLIAIFSRNDPDTLKPMDVLGYRFDERGRRRKVVAAGDA